MDPVDAILRAAERRFFEYGPKKSTMAEIAADCAMSVGNLYRHFSSKEAIVVACMERYLTERLRIGIAAAEACDDALDALRAFARQRLRFAHARFASARHLPDLVALVDARHRDLLNAFDRRVIEALRVILERGVAQGRFACADPARTAGDIHHAMLRYNHPVTLRETPLAVLQEDLDRLITLFYQGLRA